MAHVDINWCVSTPPPQPYRRFLRSRRDFASLKMHTCWKHSTPPLLDNWQLDANLTEGTTFSVSIRNLEDISQLFVFSLSNWDFLGVFYFNLIRDKIRKKAHMMQWPQTSPAGVTITLNQFLPMTVLSRSGSDVSWSAGTLTGLFPVVLFPSIKWNCVPQPGLTCQTVVNYY